jgi:hypothetical protein
VRIKETKKTNQKKNPPPPQSKTNKQLETNQKNNNEQRMDLKTNYVHSRRKRNKMYFANTFWWNGPRNEVIPCK